MTFVSLPIAAYIRKCWFVVINGLCLDREFNCTYVDGTLPGVSAVFTLQTHTHFQSGEYVRKAS